MTTRETTDDIERLIAHLGIRKFSVCAGRGLVMETSLRIGLFDIADFKAVDFNQTAAVNAGRIKPREADIMVHLVAEALNFYLDYRHIAFAIRQGSKDEKE